MKNLLLIILLGINVYSIAQKDTTKREIPIDSLNRKATPMTHLNKIDSVLKYHSPKKAAIRSAIFPGLGQIYNKKYWKLPIVYGALGTSAYVFFYNLSTYKQLRFAYKAKLEAVSQGIPYRRPDSTDYFKINPIFIALDVGALRQYRDEFRKNIDYSVLAFILLWGLNVADASVDAHLKTFDVSPNLSLHLKVGHSEIAGNNGISLVLALK